LHEEDSHIYEKINFLQEDVDLAFQEIEGAREEFSNEIERVQEELSNRID